MKLNSNWRNKIEIKERFTDDTTPELIVELTNELIKQIQHIIIRESSGDLIDKDSLVSELEEIKDHFDFLRGLADGSIPESEWGDYDFDGDYEKMFNYYLDDLYDLGDHKPVDKFNVQHKFIWIG